MMADDGRWWQMHALLEHELCPEVVFPLFSSDSVALVCSKAWESTNWMKLGLFPDPHQYQCHLHSLKAETLWRRCTMLCSGALEILASSSSSIQAPSKHRARWCHAFCHAFLCQGQRPNPHNTREPECWEPWEVWGPREPWRFTPLTRPKAGKPVRWLFSRRAQFQLVAHHGVIDFCAKETKFFLHIIFMKRNGTWDNNSLVWQHLERFQGFSPCFSVWKPSDKFKPFQPQCDFVFGRAGRSVMWRDLVE